MSLNHLNSVVCRNARQLGAMKLVILVILSCQLVAAARDYDEFSRDIYGVCSFD